MSSSNELTATHRKVILALADCGMNASEAARLLGLHRNTVVNSLERIGRMTGKDPYNFYDLYDLVQAVKQVDRAEQTPDA